MAIVFSLDNDAGGLFQIDAASGVISRKGTLTAGTAYTVAFRVTDTATGQYFGLTDTITATAALNAIKGAVFEGDSITYGLTASDRATTSYPARFAALTGLPINNNGVSGDTLVNMDSRYATDLAPLYSAGSLNTLAILAGVNDIYDNNASLATLQSAMQSITSKAKATGFIVAVSTVMNRSDSKQSTALNSVRTAFNDWLRNNFASLGTYLIDFDAIPESQDPNNTTYYADKLHPTDALYSLMASKARVAMGVPLAPAPTAYTLNGPSAATIGSASANFVVAVSGTLAASVTVTPSDGGAGGTFTPASVTLTTATNAAAAFTYTPAGSAGSRTISVTNTGGLTNPAPISLTVSAGATNADQFLRLSMLGGLIEAVDGSGYSYTLNDAQSFYNNAYGASAKSIPAGADGYAGAVSVNTTDAHGILVGLSTNGTPSGFGNIQYFVFVENNAYNYSGGNAGATVAPAVNDVIRLRAIRSSSSIVCEISKDGGSTWTLGRTWTGVSGALYFKGGTAGPNSTLKRPFGSASMA